MNKGEIETVLTFVLLLLPFVHRSAFQLHRFGYSPPMSLTYLSQNTEAAFLNKTGA